MGTGFRIRPARQSRRRIPVFGPYGLTNSYAVDAAGNITRPLAGSLPARGLTTAQLSLALSERTGLYPRDQGGDRRARLPNTVITL